MGEDQAGQAGNGYLVPVGLVFLIGNREQQQRHITRGFPVAFHGGDLHGLVFQRVQAMEIPDNRLGGGKNQNQPQAHGQRAAVRLNLTFAKQIPGTDTRHHERASQERGHHHVGKAIRKGRIEYRLAPGGDKEHPIPEFRTGGGMHPAIG